METSIRIMAETIRRHFTEDGVSMYLFGSGVMEDFRPGWSDIDFVFFTSKPLTDSQAQALLPLRQKLTAEHPGNPYFRSFEGIITSLDAYLGRGSSPVVYWGTSGQRIRESYTPDVFSRYLLIRQSRLILGDDIRPSLPLPTRTELREGIGHHYRTIREHAVTTGPELYSCGWLLDIARGLYTLRTGDVISKTRAGQWALEENLCPDPEVLEKTLQIRRCPLAFRDDLETLAWLCTLGPMVQRFADVLQKALEADV